MFITNLVPTSGRPKEPVGQSICSGVTPKAFGLVNKLITSLSSKGKLLISISE